MVYASGFPLAAKPNLWLLFLLNFVQGFPPSCNARTSYINMGVFSSCVALAVLIGSSSSLQFAAGICRLTLSRGCPLRFTSSVDEVGWHSNPRHIPVHDARCTLHLYNYKTTASSTMKEVGG
ncbi:hypothetical protein V8C34DRAFT_130859 [Trichoderma compactum]